MKPVELGRPLRADDEMAATIRLSYQQYLKARAEAKSWSPAVMCKHFGLSETAYRNYALKRHKCWARRRDGVEQGGGGAKRGGRGPQED